MAEEKCMRVDAHHHLWRYDAGEYGWIDELLQALRRDFLPADLEREMRAAGVDAAVAVQARQTMEETRQLLELAKESRVIRGVVGWAAIAAEDFPAVVEELAEEPLLKGLRHVVQAEPKGFLDGAEFNRGIGAMRGTGLVYDLLVYAPQLEEATRFVDRHPEQVFVLDHMGKPAIARGGFAEWARDFRELARRENVVCKVSGMVTEADWERWTEEDLQRYFDVAVEAFGPSRLMVGSDWPVLTVACEYGRWWETVRRWTGRLSSEERAAIEGEVAARVYGL
jgi:L-fuconolactonase